MSIRVQIRGCAKNSHLLWILSDGEMLIPDHPDMDAELAAIELGFETPKCLEIYNAYEQEELNILFTYITGGNDDERQALWSRILLDWIENWTDVIKDQLQDRLPRVFQDYMEALEQLRLNCDMGGRYRYHATADGRRSIERFYRLVVPSVKPELRHDPMLAPSLWVFTALVSAFDVSVSDHVEEIYGYIFEMMQSLVRAARELTVLNSRGCAKIGTMVFEAEQQEYTEDIQIAIRHITPTAVTVL